MAESAGSPAAVATANSPQQQQPQQQQQQNQTQTQTNSSTQPPDISSSQLASPPITGTGIFSHRFMFVVDFFLFYLNM